MGGFVVRHDPKTKNALCQNVEVFRIFEEVGWTTYFERLTGFGEAIVLQFAQNLTKDH